MDWEAIHSNVKSVVEDEFEDLVRAGTNPVLAGWIERVGKKKISKALKSKKLKQSARERLKKIGGKEK